MKNKIFVWIALGTILLLMVPLFLMKLNIPLYDPGSGYGIINWNLFDFIVMGSLIFGTAALFVVIARKFQKRTHRIVLAIVLLLGFLWLWSELAVGIFTNWGS
jgi:hypothetical protein